MGAPALRSGMPASAWLTTRDWQKRQPEVMTAIERHGITAPLTTQLPLPSDRESRPHPRDADEGTHTNSNGNGRLRFPGAFSKHPDSDTVSVIPQHRLGL